jgi:hypothetical protein
MASRTRTASTGEGQGGLPAKRLLGREVVVVLGASDPGVALLARALHALGVDMLEGDGADLWSGEAGDWRRPALTEINAALLDAIDRPPDHPAHALPFPPGWWRRPAVQKLRRDLAAAVETALETQTEPWGFADLATARLLPVWQEVFEQLGLSPVYLWALTHPTAHAGKGRGSRDAAEVRWFAYGADIYRYAGEQIALVIDEGDWRDDPQRLIERLVERLRVRWRGTRLDLYETVGAVVAQGQQAAEEAPQPAGLPLSMSFYQSAARMDEDPEARTRVAAMAESAELLRPLITPFLPALQAGGPAGAPGEDVVSLRQEIEALRQTCADLRRQAESASPPQVEPTASPDGRIAGLELELEARVAETRWLHEHYKARLDEAEGEAEALRAQIAGRAPGEGGETAPAAGQDEELAAAHAELRRLQSEMINLNNANERYLARIYELKKALEDRGAMSRVGG